MAAPNELVTEDWAALRIADPVEDALIAEGGYGSVYEGTYKGQPVAIKDLRLMALRASDRAGMVDVALREVRAQAACNASGLSVPVLAYATRVNRSGEVAGFRIAMPLGQRSLNELMVDPSLTFSDRLDLAAQVVACVSYLHGRGIIHQDVKPSNFIIFTEGGRRVLRVCDFGQAKLRSSALTAGVQFSTGRPWGTLEFAPPEAMAGGASSPSSDIWSTGLTLYCIFSGGRQPWEGLRPPAMDFGMFFQQTVLTAGQRPGIAHLCPELRPGGARIDLADMLNDCLQHDALRRPTAEALARALAGRYVPRVAAAPAAEAVASAAADVTPVSAAAPAAAAASPSPYVELRNTRHGRPSSRTSGRSRGARSPGRARASRFRYPFTDDEDAAATASAARADPMGTEDPVNDAAALSSSPSAAPNPGAEERAPRCASPPAEVWPPLMYPPMTAAMPVVPSAAAPPPPRPAALPHVDLTGVGSMFGDHKVTAAAAQGPPDIQVAFLMDCTGSMGGWMAQCRDKVESISRDVQTKFPRSNCTFAFVGYRDHCDASAGNQFAILPFTTAAAVAAFVRRQPATGGGDAPEDVAGGIRKALSLQWSNNVARIMIHICDAPAHGDAYNGGAADNHRAINTSDDWHVSDKLEVLMTEVARKRIDYYFLRLNSTTDVMQRCMVAAYDASTKKNTPFSVIDLTTGIADMLNVVTACVTASMASMGFA